MTPKESTILSTNKIQHTSHRWHGTHIISLSAASLVAPRARTRAIHGAQVLAYLSIIELLAVEGTIWRGEKWTRTARLTYGLPKKVFCKNLVEREKWNKECTSWQVVVYFTVFEFFLFFFAVKNNLKEEEKKSRMHTARSSCVLLLTHDLPRSSLVHIAHRTQVPAYLTVFELLAVEDTIWRVNGHVQHHQHDNSYGLPTRFL